MVAWNTHQFQLQLAHVVISLVILEPHLSLITARPDEHTHYVQQDDNPRGYSSSLSLFFPLKVSRINRYCSIESIFERGGTWRPFPGALWRANCQLFSRYDERRRALHRGRSDERVHCSARRSASVSKTKINIRREMNEEEESERGEMKEGEC